MSKKMKRYLMLIAAIGLLAVGMGGSGTFATFNAEVANTGNTFETGTLFLHDNGGTNTCTSESNASNTNTAGTGCDTLFTINPAVAGQTYTKNLTLSNAGSIDAQDIKFDENGNGCTDKKPKIATLGAGLSGSVSSITLSNLTETLLGGTVIEVHENNDANTQAFTVTGGPYAPGGSVPVTVTTATANFSYTTAATVSLDAFGAALCSQLLLSIQEETDANFNADVTNRCAFPSSIVATCGTTGTALNDTGLGSLQSLTLDNTGLNGNTGTLLKAKKSRYFKISIQVPSNLANTAQNDQVTFDLRWHIDQ